MVEETTTPPVVNNHVTINAPAPASMGVLERNWLVALLLSIFLGGLGIDQFYLGKTGKGILKFFTLGLFGILYIVDIIMIATKSVPGIVWIDQNKRAAAPPVSTPPPSTPVSTE